MMIARRNYAIFSEGSQKYRYLLNREFVLGSGICNFIMLNPSTATGTVDDPTIKRCIMYAMAWGYKELIVTNLFAYRATDRTVMKAQGLGGIGRDNDRWILEAVHKTIRHGGIIVAAWGTGGNHLDRAMYVRKMVGGHPLHALRVNADGTPGHPLYLPKGLKPVIYRKETLGNVCGFGVHA